MERLVINNQMYFINGTFQHDPKMAKPFWCILSLWSHDGEVTGNITQGYYHSDMPKYSSQQKRIH